MITIACNMHGCFRCTVFRQGFQYSKLEWVEIKRLSEESHIERKHQTRLRLELCLKREQHELMKGNRVYTNWMGDLLEP
ncbi:hypothetical protein D915_010415 [Fasciola hepatica]|uniref:Uncharacterized protein n=1 Tax=Fasciola hepatica TaxID=6192 RepID=A0A4E0QUY5_FASHE|nr:hypothetical protein D915_010415 [Fasciola hepatica]